MTRRIATADPRVEDAFSAWATLAHGGRDEAVLHIQCQHGHHMAVVYDTPKGLVVRGPLRGRSHGSRDRIDMPHGADEVEYFIDFLVAGPGVDDTLPVWCDCGPRTLSRASVAEWVAAHDKRVVID